MPQVLQAKGEANSVSDQQNQLKEEFERLLEETLQQKYEQGDIVKGAVVRVERDGVLVDVGAKSEGFVPQKEVSNVPVDKLDDVVKVGDKLEFYILKEENENGQLTLSLKRVAQARGWVLLEDHKKNDETIKAKISNVVKGGVVVDVYGLRGFVPASQLRVKGTTPEELIGMEIPMKILETDIKRNKLILSQRLAIQEEKAAQREKSWAHFNPVKSYRAKWSESPISVLSSILVDWTDCFQFQKSRGSAYRIHQTC
ncbi:MAG: 30S ribosomal protein S1 [Candidatus Melainabacteria bacterium]|nr:MAG: 30S ribosomal protein S1 [Candidatus Melainabacteria bacterium]